MEPLPFSQGWLFFFSCMFRKNVSSTGCLILHTFSIPGFSSTDVDMTISELQNRQNDGSDEEDQEDEESYMIDREESLILDVDS